MYKVQETDYGLEFSLEGFVQEEEMKSFSKEVGKVMRKLTQGFGILADMRGMSTLPPESRAVMEHNMELAKQAGMGRSAEIVNDFIAAMQFRRMAKEAGISSLMRQIDAGSVADCKRIAIDWIVKGIDPDK